MRIKDPKNVILIATPGVGKTTCFRFLFEKCAQEYLAGASELPIFLSAKFWKRNFSTLEEGICNELLPFLSYLTPDLVKLECTQGKYLVFIDGLDECMNDRDLLIEEINKLPGVKCIVSCRKERYYNELVDFQTYQLDLLSDEELISISTRILGYSTSMTFYSMDSGLKSLIKNPLYFYMWLSYCMKNPNSKIPLNMSNFFNEFVGYLLKDF